MAGAGGAARGLAHVRALEFKEAQRVEVFARLHIWGIIGAMIFFVLGLTPSLLPRTWFYQGVVSGWAAGIGYMLGLLLHWIYRTFLQDLRPWMNAQNWPPRVQKWVRGGLIGVGILWMLVMVGFSWGWQRKLADMAEVPYWTWWQFVLVVPVAWAMFFLVVGIARALKRAADWLMDHAPRRIQPRARSVAAWALVILAWVWFVHNAVPGAIVGVGERFFTEQNRGPDPEMTAPTQPERSGSPESPVDFNGVGFYGSRFLFRGASAAELADATGAPAKEPIRVYAGLGNAADAAERAQLLISELERTNAQDRKAMLLLMTTGTGWVSDYAVQSFELLYGGDTAIAAGQYSAMPSALHFLAGGEQVQTAGRELLTPVINWWNGLPKEHRPKLYLYGESLGTTGVEAAFSGLRDVVNSVDGILLTGPPHFNPLREQFVTRRDPGTTETNPTYGDGLVVRFATEEPQIRQWVTRGGGSGTPDTEWGPARMLYVQHPSDPVAWWSFAMVLQEPDWLKETSSEPEQRAMTWMPFVSFLQVSADLPVAANAPIGYGHNYGDAVLAGFTAIGGVAMSDARLTQLEEKLVEIRGDDPK